jgi:hypothetical protein
VTWLDADDEPTRVAGREGAKVNLEACCPTPDVFPIVADINDDEMVGFLSSSAAWGN